MKMVVEKIEQLKAALADGSERGEEEVVQMAETAYKLAAGVFSKIRKNASGPADELKNEYRFRSLHHLEHVMQSAPEMLRAKGLDFLVAETLTALNLVLVILEDDATAMDFAEAC